jgi:hypothetical protein
MRNWKNLFKNSKTRKSEGMNVVPMELWKYSGQQMRKVLLHFFNDVWKQGRVLNEWETALKMNICKKGDRKICEKYKRIFLL